MQVSNEQYLLAVQSNAGSKFAEGEGDFSQFLSLNNSGTGEGKENNLEMSTSSVEASSLNAELEHNLSFNMIGHAKQQISELYANNQSTTVSTQSINGGINNDATVNNESVFTVVNVNFSHIALGIFATNTLTQNTAYEGVNIGGESLSLSGGTASGKSYYLSSPFISLAKQDGIPTAATNQITSAIATETRQSTQLKMGTTSSLSHALSSYIFECQVRNVTMTKNGNDEVKLWIRDYNASEAQQINELAQMLVNWSGEQLPTAISYNGNELWRDNQFVSNKGDRNAN